MSPIFIFIQVFPAIAIPIAWILIDQTKSQKQKGNKIFIATGSLAMFLIFLVLLWAVFRGDKHAIDWYKALVSFFY